jgi:carboxyl-terminal processing protease
MVNKKLQVWLPLIFSIVLVAGMFLGYQLNGGKSKKFFGTNKLTPLQEAVEIIKMRYVDSVNTVAIEGKAIQEIMDELDPHSVYLPPPDVQLAKEDMEGKYEGIGIEFNLFSDTIHIVQVMPDGPGEKAGLQVGDIIFKANDSIVSGRGLSSDAVKKIIRGKKGSKVNLLVWRGNKQLNFPVTRGNIPVPSVVAAYMIDKSTACLKLKKFTETSYEEFMQAMEDLEKKGMHNLVLDLRDNGGGLMDEAADIADEFLDGEKLIVFTEGVKNKKKEIKCKRPGILETGKLVVLVNENTASASEVLAGALQDWCRAKIVGRRTFGKGLVQQQYPLSDGSALRLTIARYYTPLGRSIQRSYEKGKKIYMDEIDNRMTDGELFNADSNKLVHGRTYLTICKDSVYGGAGIMPDIFIPADSSRFRKKIEQAMASGYLENLAYQYYLKNKKELQQVPALKDYINSFDANKIWDGYIRYPGGPTAFEIFTGKEKEFLSLRLKALLARMQWRNAGYYETMNAGDDEVKKSLDQINK